MQTAPELTAATFMLSAGEIGEVSALLTRYVDATMVIQSIMAGLTVKLKIACDDDVAGHVDQRLAVYVSVRFDGGYSFLTKEHSALNQVIEAGARIDRLFKPGLSLAFHEQALIIANWALRDLSNGIQSEDIHSINRINRDLASLVDKSNRTMPMSPYVTMTYLMNGLREIRTGLEHYDLLGRARQPEDNSNGVLVSRWHDPKVLKAVIGVFSNE